MSNFQNRLRHLRKALGLSQEQLGQNFNLAKSTISQYELGKRTPDSIVLEKFADFFNVTVDYLLGRSEIKNPYDRDGSLVKESSLETKYYRLDKSKLPVEAIEQINEYIDFIKQKYNSNEDLRENNTEK